MERLTDRTTADDLRRNYEGLRAAGMPRDIATERYIKLADYENKEEKQHGAWKYEHPEKGYYCTQCRYFPTYTSALSLPKYCPNCGSKNGERGE